MQHHVREDAERKMTKDERHIMNALRLSSGMVMLASDDMPSGVQLSAIFATDKHEIYGISPIDSSNLFAIHLDGFIPVATIDQVNSFYCAKFVNIFQEMTVGCSYKDNDTFEEVYLFERNIDYMVGQEYEVVTPFYLFGDSLMENPRYESEGLYRSFEEAIIALNAYIENMKVIGMNPIPTRYIRNRVPGWNKVERLWVEFIAKPRPGDEPEIFEIRMVSRPLSIVPASLGADGYIKGYTIFNKFDNRESLEKRILRVIKETNDLEQEIRREMKDSQFIYRKANAFKT